jgi:hypothetical protein
MSPVPVLPVYRGDDGVWEALVQPIHGGGDLQVRALDDASATPHTVRVLGEEKTLLVFFDKDTDGEGEGVVRYEDALPG